MSKVWLRDSVISPPTSSVPLLRRPAGDVDFVSRFFAPLSGIDEDPVTGSAHCTLAPYWAERLGRNPLRARQISSRGGDLLVEWAGERVRLTGECADYLEGAVHLPGS